MNLHFLGGARVRVAMLARTIRVRRARHSEHLGIYQHTNDTRRDRQIEKAMSSVAVVQRVQKHCVVLAREFI